MKLKLRKIAVVLTAALPLAAAAIPTKAEAFGFLIAPVLIGAAIVGAGSHAGGAWDDGYGGDGYGGGSGYGGGYGYGGGGCCRQEWAPPPPPPCCYTRGWDRGREGWGRGGYDGW